MRSFVMPNTAIFARSGNLACNRKEGAMTAANKVNKKAKKNADKDVATLIELLRMEAELRAHSQPHQASEIELLRQDQSLLDMWPEACRRTGAGVREFPAGVIKLWKESLGGTH